MGRFIMEDEMCINMCVFAYPVLDQLPPTLGGGSIMNKGYMEYHSDFVRHSLLNDWCEAGTKFEDCGTTCDELGTKYNSEVIKYRPL